jgi:Cu/Ag efflux protein CusF
MTKINIGDNRRVNTHQFNLFSPRLTILLVSTLLVFSTACNRNASQPATTRYSLKGRVVSIDKLAGAANIDTEPIAGFMDRMTMAYAIKPPATFDQLQPGDTITADLIVEPNNKYWLESVKVTGHSKTAAGR